MTLNVSEIFTGTVRDLSLKGTGVVEHPSGQICFVPGVIPGEKVRVEIEKVSKRFSQGRLIEVLETSEYRQVPPCPIQGFNSRSCGGCGWMHIEYQAQLAFKGSMVKSALERIGLESDICQPIWGSPKELGYRNRAQFKTDGKKIGFVANQSKELIDVDNCPILNEACNHILSEIRSQLPNSKWVPRGRFKWSLLDIDDAMNASDIIPNKRRPFKQGNLDQNLRMRQWIKENVTDAAHIMELFCGDGNFTKVLVETSCTDIKAFEFSSQSISDLKDKKLPKVSAFVLDLYSKTKSLFEYTKNVDTLVLDPPREGFEGLSELAKYADNLRSIYYVSCNLHSFVRDIKPLLASGWKLEVVQPLDQFPHTPHIELLAKLVMGTIPRVSPMGSV